MVGIFGSSSIGIGVSIGLVNRFSGPAKQVIRDTRAMSAAQQSMYRKNLEMSRNANAMGAVIGVSMLRGLSEWTKVGAEFKYIMASVGAVTQSTDKQLQSLSDTSRKLGKDTMFTASDVASGMKFMGMAGMNAEEVQANIKAAVSLAGSTQSSLGGKGGSADIMTNVMKAFGGGPDDAMKYADILTTATVSANTSLWDLGEALKYSSSTLKTMGYGVEDATMMVGVLGNAGIQGSMAGTAIENMVRYITKASGEFRTGKQGDALKMLGLQPAQLADSQGNLKNLKDILKMIGGQVKGMGNIARQNAMNQIFGVRGNRSAALLVDNLNDVDDLYNKISNSSGTSNQILGVMMDTLRGKTLQLKSAWDDFKIAFTEGLEPLLMIGATVLTKILNITTTIFDTPYIGTFLAVGITGFIALKTATMAWAAISSGIKLMYMANSVAFNGFRALTITGYGQMAAGAARFGAAAGAANMAAAGGGYGALGGALRANAAGRAIRGVGRRGAGRYVSMAAGGLGGRYMQRYGTRVTGSAAARRMATVRIFGITRIMPMLTSALTFLSGPIGLSLMAITGAIYALSSAQKHRAEMAHGRISARQQHYASTGISMGHDAGYEFTSARNQGDIGGQRAAVLMNYLLTQSAADKASGNTSVFTNVFVDMETQVQTKVEQLTDDKYYKDGFN